MACRCLNNEDKNEHYIRFEFNKVFIQISETQVGRAIRTKKWKYSIRAPHKIGFLHSKSKKYREDFLYDLENDIHEKYNLINDPEFSDIRAKLREKLKNKMIEVGEKIPKIKGAKS